MNKNQYCFPLLKATVRMHEHALSALHDSFSHFHAPHTLRGVQIHQSAQRAPDLQTVRREGGAEQVAA